MIFIRGWEGGGGGSGGERKREGRTERAPKWSSDNFTSCLVWLDYSVVKSSDPINIRLTFHFRSRTVY